MDSGKLVYMANQIGRFFQNQPEAEAVANTADHIKKFWDPRMRKAIFAHVDHENGEGLQPYVLKAIQALKSEAATPKV